MPKPNKPAIPENQPVFRDIRTATGLYWVHSDLKGATILDQFQNLQEIHPGGRVPDVDIIRFLYSENNAVLTGVQSDDGPDFLKARTECVDLYQYLGRHYLPARPELVENIFDEWPELPLVFRLATVYRDSPVVDGIWWKTHQECKSFIEETLHSVYRHTLFLWESGKEDDIVLEIPRSLPEAKMLPLRERLYRGILGIARNGGYVARSINTREKNFVDRGYHFEGGKCRLWSLEELMNTSRLLKSMMPHDA